MAALLASVTCSAPSDSVHAIQLSTVPKQRSRARSSSNWSSRSLDLRGRDVGREPEALASQLEAASDRAQVLPAEAGTDRLPRRAGPRRRSSRAGSRCRRRRPDRRRRGRRAPRRARWRPSRWRRTRPAPAPATPAAAAGPARARRGRRPPTIAARTDDVPTSTTRIAHVIFDAYLGAQRSRDARTHHGHAGLAEGVGEAELARVEDAVGVERPASPLRARRTRRPAPRARSGPGSGRRRGGG